MAKSLISAFKKFKAVFAVLTFISQNAKKVHVITQLTINE